MLDIWGMFGVWEAMKATIVRAPVDDFNTLHRRMNQLELLWSCLVHMKLNHLFRGAIENTLRCRTTPSQHSSTRYIRLIWMTSIESGKSVMPSGIFQIILRKYKGSSKLMFREWKHGWPASLPLIGWSILSRWLTKSLYFRLGLLNERLGR